MKRKDIIAIVVSFVLIVLIVGLSYAYFALNTNLTNNISQNLTFNEDYSFDVEVSNRTANPFTITNTDMIYSGIDEVVANTSENFIINVTNNSEDTLYCTYDIVWEWQSGTGLSNYTISSGPTKEYTVFWNGTEVQVPNYNASTFVLGEHGTGAVASGTSETFVVPFETRFYNLADVDQSGHFNKTYLGYAKIDNVVCSNTMLLTKYISYGAPRSGTDAVSSSPWILTSDHTGEWRYARKNPDNYIEFNGELWRIIGVMPNMVHCTRAVSYYDCATNESASLIKIIKNQTISSTNFLWDSKGTRVGSVQYNSGSNDWSDSQLMLMLNGSNYLKTGYDANDNKLHQSYTITNNVVADANGIIFYDATYSYLDGSGTTVYKPSEATNISYSPTSATLSKKIEGSALSQIATIKWYLYGTNLYNTEGSPSAFYNKERNIDSSGAVYVGTTPENRPVYWYGKIGLMYPSDYGYATNGGITYNRTTCLGYQMIQWHSGSYKTDCAGGSFLWYTNITSTAPGTSGISQWMITPYTGSSDQVFYVDSSGQLRYNTPLSNSYAVRPVLYLKPEVAITGGTGKWNDPYTIT